MKMKLKEIEEEIKKLAPDAVSAKIFMPKAGRQFLFVCNDGSKSSIRVYDRYSGMQEVAEITYRASSSSCYISAFETMEEYQRLGLGKCIYQMALAHADLLGATEGSCLVNPTNNIKGVSKPLVDCYKEEATALREIYTRLGNSIVKCDFGWRASCKWKENEKILELDEKQHALITEFARTNTVGV